jgi:prepilin-type N-terminal cleavage/methylation domain-containing protein
MTGMAEKYTRKKPDKSESRGYTMLEIMTVVGLIGLLVALAVPNLQRARQNALETGAIEGLKQLAEAEEMYYEVFKSYTSGHDQWHDLRRCDAIDAKGYNRLAGRRGKFIKGYSIQLINLGAYPQNYSIVAWPIERGLDLKTFFIVSDGIIRDSQTREPINIY